MAIRDNPSLNGCERYYAINTNGIFFIKIIITKNASTGKIVMTSLLNSSIIASINNFLGYNFDIIIV